MSNNPTLTATLETYLLAIYLTSKDRSVTRVRDLTKMLNVKPASASAALKRLSDLKLIIYNKRDYIELSLLGQQAINKLACKHAVLEKLLCNVLEMNKENAKTDAFRMHQGLSDHGLSCITKYFEKIEAQKLESSTQKKLSSIYPGMKAKITKLCNDEEKRVKLLSTGLNTGTTITAIKKDFKTKELVVRLEDNLDLKLSIADADTVTVVSLD